MGLLSLPDYDSDVRDTQEGLRSLVSAGVRHNPAQTALQLTCGTLESRSDSWVGLEVAGKGGKGMRRAKGTALQRSGQPHSTAGRLPTLLSTLVSVSATMSASFPVKKT